MADAPRRALIAYDGSAGAVTAVRAAASLLAGARAFVVNVPPDPTVRAGTAVAMLSSASPAVVEETLEGMLAEVGREAAETAAEGVEHARTLGLDAEAVDVAPSVPQWAALLETAHRLEADVVVCGTRGRGAFARALLGSTSTSLLHRTDLPLLVVPDGGGALDGPVVAAYDGSDNAKRAIEAVGRLLSDRRTVVVHGWEPVFHRSVTVRAVDTGAPIDELPEVITDLHAALAHMAIATTDEGVALAREAGLDAVGDTAESHDGPWRTVAAAARGHGASVIAVGTRGMGAAKSVLLGSVSSGLVHNAEVPVLVVP